MRTLYLDCFSGISGNMFLGALVGLGFPEDDLKKVIAALGFHPEILHVSGQVKSGLHSTLISVDNPENQPHRHLSDINTIIDNSRLPDSVVENSKKVFLTLAKAEAAVHGTTLEKIHFHEVGAVDAMVDIVGVCVGLDYLKVEKLVCSPLPLGHGTIECAHGVLPVPAPATVEILQGVPTYCAGRKGEHVTPTGASLVKSLAHDFGGIPSIVLENSAYGAGTREFDSGPPTLLRALLGNSPKQLEGEYVIETNIDDMSPELYGPMMDRLFDAGALDVTLTPCIMKKNRPGILVTAVCSDATKEMVVDALLTESTTIGVRIQKVSRVVCERSFIEVNTEFGPVTIKVSTHKGRPAGAKPEFEQCKNLAEKTNVPVARVYEAALFAYRSLNPE